MVEVVLVVAAGLGLVWLLAPASAAGRQTRWRQLWTPYRQRIMRSTRLR
ncbi:MAG: chromophore lyase CpcT/CpeT [Alicyclobacillus sp.]|nr:chromophore lyase CpcT/CpeT [Alicyclobacillus sp.]